MKSLVRNNVRVCGNGGDTLVFAHGFGCNQAMWRAVAPAFEARHRVVLFDLVGARGSDLTQYSFEKYGTLAGHAADVVEILRDLGQSRVTFIGHSVSAMIGMLAYNMAPDLIARLVLICPSPRYIDDEDYRGGFSAGEIAELLEFLDVNPMGWSQAMAPVIMGNADRPELSQELAASFCSTDPDIARHFARVTFTGDNRADLDNVQVPVLILECRDDVVAPPEVGAYLGRRLPHSRRVLLDATGHCPNLSAPDQTIDAIAAFLAATSVAGEGGGWDAA